MGAWPGSKSGSWPERNSVRQGVNQEEIQHMVKVRRSVGHTTKVCVAPTEMQFLAMDGVVTVLMAVVSAP